MSDQYRIYVNPEDQADADSITLLRMLDVLYLMLWSDNKDFAVKLMDMHANGGLIGPNVNFDPEKML